MEADDKRYARVKVIETVIAEIERGMRERGFPVPGLAAEQRQVGLALAAQHGEVDLDAADPARLRQRARLRLDRLRGEDAAAAAKPGLAADALEVARQLLDGVDRARCA